MINDFNHQQALSDIALLNDIQNITPLTAVQRRNAQLAAARLLAIVNDYNAIVEESKKAAHKVDDTSSNETAVSNEPAIVNTADMEPAAVSTDDQTPDTQPAMDAEGHNAF